MSRWGTFYRGASGDAVEEQAFLRWLELPDAQPVRFDDLPGLIAGALHDGEFAQAAAEINLEAELRAMVTAGELMVRDPLTLGPHTFPTGRALRNSLLLPEDLRPLLAKRGIGLRFKADIAHPLPDVKTAPIDWAAYRFRDGFTLFEVACLLQRLDPRAVSDDAHHAIRRRGGTAAAVLDSPAAAAEMLHLNPAAYFVPPVGDTLERLKRAAGSRLGLSVNAARARELAAMLGLPYPSELEREAPAPAAPAPAIAERPAAASRWTPDRLEELRAYREAHGTTKAAEWAGVSPARVRALLPGDKPQPKGYSAFNPRLK